MRDVDDRVVEFSTSVRLSLAAEVLSGPKLVGFVSGVEVFHVEELW